MIKIGFLFGRNKKKKPKAVAFIDYEHWYISMEKLYNMKPDLQSWVNSIMEMADVKEIIFFADFFILLQYILKAAAYVSAAALILSKINVMLTFRPS